MVKQVLHYSDGSETVINYRGVVDQEGQVRSEKVDEVVEEVAAAPDEPEVVVEEVVAEPVLEEVQED